MVTRPGTTGPRGGVSAVTTVNSFVLLRGIAPTTTSQVVEDSLNCYCRSAGGSLLSLTHTQGRVAAARSKRGRQRQHARGSGRSLMLLAAAPALAVFGGCEMGLELAIDSTVAWTHPRGQSMYLAASIL